VFSDIPNTALAQARRLLPGATANDDDDIIEVLWAQPAAVGQHFPAAVVPGEGMEDRRALHRSPRHAVAAGAMGGGEAVGYVVHRHRRHPPRHLRGLSLWQATVTEPQQRAPVGEAMTATRYSARSRSRSTRAHRSAQRAAAQVAKLVTMPPLIVPPTAINAGPVAGCIAA
jgi:hypothetical protein